MTLWETQVAEETARNAQWEDMNEEREIERSSRKRMGQVRYELTVAHSLMEKAADTIEECSYHTVWEDKLLSLANEIMELASYVNAQKEEIERWKW